MSNQSEFVDTGKAPMTRTGILKLPHPSISPDAPWDDDILDRRSFGTTLADMVEGIDQPYVISLKGDWGSGKSVFLRRLEAELESRTPKIPVVFVDAWKNDYYEDPIFALISAVNRRLGAESPTSGQQSRSLTDRGIRLFGSAGKVVSPLSKIAGAGLDAVTGGGASKFSEGIGELGQALFNANAEKQDAHSALLHELESARDFLLGFGSDGIARSTKGRKVVVVVDELDRCRPGYGIKLLERIKHFFDLRGFLFIIAIDGENIQQAVQSLYGPATDGERYLRKFFDLEMYLPQPDAMSFNAMLRKSYGVLESCDFPEASWVNVLPMIRETAHSAEGDGRPFAMLEASAHFEHIAKVFGLKLRDQAQAYSRLYASVAALGNRASFMPIAAAFMVCLRYFDPASYEKWRVSGRAPGVDGLDGRCEWADRVKASDAGVAHALRSYLALAAQGSVGMMEQTIRLGFVDPPLAIEVGRRLPQRNSSWKELLDESQRELFSLSATIRAPD